MYSVVRLYKMKSTGDIDKVVDGTRSGFLPIVTKAPGFMAYTMAMSADGELVTIGMLADRDGAHESTRLAADWVRDNLAWSVEGPPKIAEGDVRIDFLHCPFRELAEAYPALVCNLHRGLCEGIVDQVGEGSVEEFATLYDHEPCHVTVSAGAR